MSRKSRREAYAKHFGAIVADINSRPPEVRHKLMWQWFFVKATLGVACIGPLIYILLSFLGNTLLQPAVVTHPWFKVLAFILLCGIAGLLSALKERLRYAYGILEIAFASAVIAQAIGQIEAEGIAAWIAAGSAVYVLAGGLDNLFSGYRNPPAFDE